MTDSPKKISFGFSKLSKQSVTSKSKKDDCSIQYIDCVESNFIKVKGDNKTSEKADLIIPLKSDKVVTGSLNSSTNVKVSKLEGTNQLPFASNKEANEIAVNVPESLDTLAVREILEDSKKEKHNEDERILTLQPPSNKDKLGSEKEPTLEDYESIPVTDFGLAMLRGMGWNPSKGIGKNEKVICVSSPVLRPKGMGLGADKLVVPPAVSTNEEEQNLKVAKKAFVQIIAGAKKNTYGQVEGFDDSGRLIIKSALSGTCMSVNECMVKAVSQDEYKRCSRVLNLIKYEEYGKRETGYEKQDIDSGRRDVPHKKSKKFD